MRDKIEALDYDKIGHVLFKGGQTFLLSRGFDGLTPLDRMRIDLPQEQGDIKSARSSTSSATLVHSTCFLTSPTGTTASSTRDP
jgi:hypothetical protein